MENKHDGKLKQSHLKLNSHLPKNCFIYFNENPLKMMRNAFYFIIKALFQGSRTHHGFIEIIII